MEFSAKQIAEILGGSVDGDANALVNNLSPIEDGKPGTLTFLANPAYTSNIYFTKATVAIVASDFTPEKALPESLTLVRVKDPRFSFSQLMQYYAHIMKPAAGVHPKAYVHDEAMVHESASIGAFVVIEKGAKIGEACVIGAQSFVGADAEIGNNSIICERVHVGARCKIGEHCMLQPGVIIGGDGFGFAPNADNKYEKVVHLGNVLIEDFVEIGAGTAIDRATLGSTVIKKGVKLDNLIQIAHNVEIGENTVIAAQSGIAGSTKIGKNCMIGGQVGIVGHIQIADEVKIAAQSGVGSSISQKGSIVQGSPAMLIGDFKRAYVHFKNLHELAETVNILKKQTN